MTHVEVYIAPALLISVPIGWRLGQLAGAGVLCALVTLIVLLERMSAC